MPKIKNSIQPDKQQIDGWIDKILTTNNLSEASSFEDILSITQQFFSDNFTDFQIIASTDAYNNVSFYLKKQAISKSEADLIFDSLLGPDISQPMDEECTRLSKTIKITFEILLEKLSIVNPGDYPDVLSKMGLKQLTTVPSLTESIFLTYSEKIIDYYQLTPSTVSPIIAQKAIAFFNMLFHHYAIYYKEPVDSKQFPVRIERHDGNTLNWFTEVEKIERLLFCTYYQLLASLGRLFDYPLDSDFWFEVAYVYEALGDIEKADELGTIGLTYMTPTELQKLIEIAINYLENNEIQRGLKYLKKLGVIFIQKEFYKQALPLWQKITEYEPAIKDNWLSLAIVFEKLGENSQAKQCRSKAGNL